MKSNIKRPVPVQGVCSLQRKDTHCFLRKELVQIAKQWGIKPTGLTKVALWEAIVKKSGCEPVLREKNVHAATVCVAQHPVTKSQVDVEKVVRPAHPEEWVVDPYRWLSNHDIAKAMKQCESPTFHFLGVVPMDFASVDYGDRCVAPIMCQFHLTTLQKKGIQQVGVIFNLDRHTQAGSHWVAMILGIDATKKGRFGAYYYNSGGHPPTPEIDDFVEKVKKQLPANQRSKFAYQWNSIRHQRGNTECGVYAVCFLHLCVLNPKVAYAELCNMSLSDEEVHTLRDCYWRKTF